MTKSLCLLVAATSLTTAAQVAGAERGEARGGETLYNGIRLPSPWPPRVTALTLDPPPLPPYLTSPPTVIPIDVGRQLFVDDFLIEHTTLQRTFHQAEYYPDNPVLKPDKPWEVEESTSGDHPAPTAMVFSDGVWYDPQDRLFKMWYMAGYCRATAYATSQDGIHWEKPALDVQPGTNIVHTSRRDSGTVWLDLAEKDPQRRYKMFLFDFKGGLSLHFSADGIHWKEVARSGQCGDRTTVFYNPFRKVWVYSLREYFRPPEGVGRCRRYWEHADVLAGAKWRAGEPPLWVGADRLDPKRPDLNIQPQLYNLDAVAYESVLLGLFSIWRGQPRDRAKPNEVCVGFSRDGFHWYRPDRRAFIPVSERQGDWNWGNVQSAGGCCLVVGDKLYFYVSGRAGVPGSPASGVCSTGLATLRRDGFASMDAGEREGTLTTRPVKFSGRYCFVNVDAQSGELRAEVLDEGGRVIAPFSRDNCVPIRVDRTLQPVRWKGADDLSALAGKPVKFRFYLRSGRLYAFWVSPESSGASHGYLAAGGPGFTGPTDTVGSAAYRP
ncbi:MAG TPA: glycosyl hydrolase family 32 [Armatimonadetes bacterium]|nr:glycosyl hydrolase family 32 [Armatimonadota bacterium]